MNTGFLNLPHHHVKILKSSNQYFEGQKFKFNVDPGSMFPKRFKFLAHKVQVLKTPHKTTMSCSKLPYIFDHSKSLNLSQPVYKLIQS